MKVNILTDNRAKKRDILAEQGLSVFIEYGSTNVLFDAGQSRVYCDNAARMGVDLNKTDYIVLSHGHYDHCGGLIYFPETAIPNIYVHPDAFAKRYAINPDGKSYREIGIPWTLDDYGVINNKVVLNHGKTEIAPDISLCAEIPSIVDFEKTSPVFYTGSGTDKIADMMKDEQMLIFDTDKGLSIFLGCSHPGIINCLNHAVKLFPGKRIYSLVAGMHLGDVNSTRLQKTIQHLMDFDIQKVVPLHCTGIFAICEMKRLLGSRCYVLCAGDTLEL